MPDALAVANQRHQSSGVTYCVTLVLNYYESRRKIIIECGLLTM